MAGKRANLSPFAHPDNPYRAGLGDLDALAAADADFGRVARRNPETGRVRADWADREYVRILMRAVIRRDFRLDLDSPAGSLAPALTNKMNYLLWIGDVAKANGVESRGICGIDIGTGGSIYFAALAANRFGWRMLATEANPDDFRMAVANVRSNRLENNVEVVFNANPGRIFCLPENDSTFFFSMCNPPFYEVDAGRRERPEFAGVDPGRGHEIAFHGGEVEFVKRMIAESQGLSNRVKVFTTLVGHKRNVSVLKAVLESAGTVIKATKVTEFCQGRTMRWGMAWTFDPDIELTSISIRQDAKAREKSRQPICHVIKDARITCNELGNNIRTWLAAVDVQVTKEGVAKSSDQCYFRLKTFATNWRGQRAKRRRKSGEAVADVAMDVCDAESKPLLDCQAYIQRPKNDSSQIVLQFVYLNGELGKNGMAELVQYLKNQLLSIV